MQKIIVAVSGGPDSMALLDILNKQDYEMIVVHVNYKLRDSADYDQHIVEEYCNKHDLILKVKVASKHESGNFQAFARNERYDYMVEIADKYGIDDIFVAHHLDDHLETYLLQKSRKSTPSYYGLNNVSKFKNKTIIRPLLDYSKKSLIAYCEENSIEFAIDESNLENVYERNKIRNTKLNKMSEEEKLLLLKEIDSENDLLMDINAVVSSYLNDFEKENSLDYLLELPDFYVAATLRMYFTKYDIYDISDSEFENIIKFLKSEGNGQYSLSDKYLLNKAYRKIDLVTRSNATYNYTFSKLEYFECEYFKISESGESTEALTLHDSDFPITIRNYQEGDSIQMHFGSKKVSRFFIDRKIPEHLRRLWPIVLNADKEIILVPKLGCNLTHFSNNPTVFVVK